MVGTKFASYRIVLAWNSKLFKMCIVVVHSTTWWVLLLSVFVCLNLDVRFWLPGAAGTANAAPQQQSQHSGNRQIYMHLCFCHFVCIDTIFADCLVFSLCIFCARCFCHIDIDGCVVKNRCWHKSHALFDFCVPINAPDTTWTVLWLWYHYSDDSI